MPIQRPCSSASGQSGGACSVSLDMPVSGAGVPPSVETIRATERLVAAIASSQKEPEPSVRARRAHRATVTHSETDVRTVAGVRHGRGTAWSVHRGRPRRADERTAGVGPAARGRSATGEHHQFNGRTLSRPLPADDGAAVRHGVESAWPSCFKRVGETLGRRRQHHRHRGQHARVHAAGGRRGSGWRVGSGGECKDFLIRYPWSKCGP